MMEISTFEMEQELEAAQAQGAWEYHEGMSLAFIWEFPSGVSIIDFDRIESSKRAFAHLEKERQFAAQAEEIERLKALLSEFYHGYVDSPPNYEVSPLEPFQDWLSRVKAIVIKESE